MLNLNRKINLLSVFFLAILGCLFLAIPTNAATTGTTTSAVYDAGASNQPNVLTWTETKPENTSISIEVRGGNVAVPDGTWTAWTGTTNGAFSTAIHLKRYSQYRAILSSTNNASWPTLDSVTLTYKDIDGVLVSSAYDTNDSVNVIAGISWTESLEGEADIKFQLRTSADGETWTEWMGPTGVNDYYTDATGGETINPAHANVSGDQWFQYQVFLISDGVNNPVLTDVTVQYVVNSPPSVQNVIASQDSEGYVNISYDIKDVDATSGTATQNFVTPTFQYSLNGGSDWNNIATTSIIFGAAPVSGEVVDTNNDGDIDNKVLEGSYLTYTARWLASSTIAANYSESFQIRVTIDDNELANSEASADSTSVILDTTVPADASLRVYATSTPATLALSASDNSSMQMRISTDQLFSGANWVDYNTAASVTLSTDPDTVYVEFKDAYGNVTAVNATTPPTPNNAMVQDISNLNLETPVFGLFSAWGIISEPAHSFGSYFVYHSDSGAADSYELTETINDRTQNYFAHFELADGSVHYYKVAAVDANGNASGFSAAVRGTANGIQDGTEGGGGEETTPPVISNVNHSDITTQSATITWETDELSDSRVDYITSTGGDFAGSPFVGVNSMLNNAAGVGAHSVTLSGLSPNTTYYYMVKSTDVSDNMASSTQDVDGYSFTTESGPTISDILTADIKNTSATITWTTDDSANSYVYYSVNSDMSESLNTGSDTETTEHSVTIAGLTPGTRYYYYVKSGLAEDKNVVDGLITYYNVTTSADLTAPVISFNEDTDVDNISDTTATISWTTDELATSTLEYGLDTSYGSSSLSNNSLNTNHSFDLTELSLGTTYYFRLKNADEDYNNRTDDNGGVGYSFTTTDSTDSAAPEITIAPAASPIGDTYAVIKWTTNEISNSRVDYGTASGVYTLSANSTSYDSAHVIALSELSVRTKYYYKVTSVDAGNNQIESAEYDFTTKDTLTEETAVTVREEVARQEGIASVVPTSSGGGGGLIFVEKAGDTTAPVISEVAVSNITSDSAVIRWKTDENADAFVEYGENNSYGSYQGSRSSALSHKVTLNRLDPSTTYHYRATSADLKGNLALAPNAEFTTLSLAEELEKKTEEELNYEDIEDLTQDLDDQSNQEHKADGLLAMASQTLQKAMGIIKQTISKVSMSSLESTLMMQQNSLEDLAKAIPAPIMSGEPRVLITAKTAAIAWKTDKESNSLVAIASDDEYKADAPNPYLQVVGNPGDSAKDHMVVIHDLEPDTVYNYQLRNQSPLGPEARSNNFSFQTKKEILEVGNYAIQNVSNSEAVFKWVTNIESDSTLKYTPYRNESLAMDETKSKYEKSITTIHELKVNDFEPGVIYKVELVSSDIGGNTAEKEIDSFSTSKDDLPPIIYQVQTSSAISPGKDAKIQSIISWMTGEPSSSRVYFQQGVASADKVLTESTKLDTNNSKKHVAVITKFDPGKIYSFRVESIDSGGNVSLSKIYTILTPRQSDSVFQVIMKNMEDVFGWMKKVK